MLYSAKLFGLLCYILKMHRRVDREIRSYFKSLNKTHRDAHKPLKIKGGYMTLPEIDDVKFQRAKSVNLYSVASIMQEKSQKKR